MNVHQVAEESLPMLDDVLGRIGIHKSGTALNLASLRRPFSDWAQQQEVTPQDFSFMVSLIGAFISEYLIAHHNAQRHIEDNRISLRLPLCQGIMRSFDPYASAAGLLQERKSLNEFLSAVGT